MPTTSLTKIIASKEYRAKHNYMSCPGDTKMPEYSKEEIEAIEDRSTRDWQIAQKFGRSVQAIGDKRYRIKHGERRYLLVKRKKENYQRILKGKQVIVEQRKVVIEDQTLNDVLSGSMSIQDFLNI